jgi:hypothetical protein
VPLPILGMVGFAVLGVASVIPGRRARIIQLGLSCLAACLGVALLTAQAIFGHICVYCCVVDASAVAGVLVAAARLRLASGAIVARAFSYAGVAALLVAAAAPLWFGFRAHPLPRAIREEMARTPAGAITVVDFVDFECPFCRMTHAELAPLVGLHRDRVRLARRQVPLSVHPHARAAARAACCGERLGRGDAMAEALFAVPVEDLSGDGCERIAQAVGIPLESYRACVADPATDARIEADRAEFKAAGGFALPTIWIDGRELVGAQSGEALKQAIENALARAGS